MGYKTVADDTAAADVPRVKIDITQFSVGMPFNFFRAMSYSQQIIADIATSITVGAVRPRKLSRLLVTAQTFIKS